MLSKWRKIENFNSVKSERVVMNYSDSRPTCTPVKSFDRQDFSQNNRVFYIPKTVGFGFRLLRSALRKDTGMSFTIYNAVITPSIQRANLLIALIIEVRY